MSDSDKPEPRSGPAASRNLHDNNFEIMLDVLVGVRLQLLLLAPNGDQVNVVGINRGHCLDGDDGVTYSYRAYKVQKFL